jgi:Protein of unknown function (DUF3050)
MSIPKQTEQLQVLAERLRPLYDRLASHPLYASFETVEDLHVFMEAHVFAVWDFMSLLKSLQRGLTCVEVPWIPGRFAASRRLVNEIVLGEESDVYGTEAVSHFELYLRAMRECGASTTAMETLIAALRDGIVWERALTMSGAPAAAQRFVRATFAVIESGKLHATAAAFTFGREDLIPDMFRGFIRDQNDRLRGRLELMRWYMERHIEVDGEEHGPMSLQMIAELCGEDELKWREATEAAETALRARILLWDGIAESLKMNRERVLVS